MNGGRFIHYYCFCGASGLEINAHKSTFHHYGVQQAFLDQLNDLYHFGSTCLSEGFKYLGYFLKLDSYKVADWHWLLMKYEHRICHWCNRFLSLGGRFVLIKVVLESQPVYWLALAHIPATVLNKIRKLTFSYLWSGAKNIHLPFTYAIGNY
jgi:hypothetical protein